MSETWAYLSLLDGKSDEVTIRPKGNSMTPLITSGQQVTIRKLRDEDELLMDDIVLAKVRGHIYLHKITAIDGDRIQISNNHGHVNGWTSRDRIAGKLK